jgi:hypothetical protein
MSRSKKTGGSRAQPTKEQSKATTTIAKRPKNKTPSTPSKLLDLPPELRNRIFRYALISDEPIEVQFHSTRRSSRRRFTIIPGLINACKQLRLETQRIFFANNEFEITPEVLMERSEAPLLSLHTMHHNVGLELRSVRVCQEIKKRFDGDLFKLKASFILSVQGNGLTIFQLIYSGDYVGRVQPPPSISVCGCDVVRWTRQVVGFYGKTELVNFLKHLKRRVTCYVSCNSTDLSRDEVVYRAEHCMDCQNRGWLRISV